MNIDRVVLGFAGTMVLLSLLLGHFVSPWWLWLGVFVGANLLQASFSGLCPLAMMLAKAGMKPGCAFPERGR